MDKVIKHFHIFFNFLKNSAEWHVSCDIREIALMYLVNPIRSWLKKYPPWQRLFLNWNFPRFREFSSHKVICWTLSDEKKSGANICWSLENAKEIYTFLFLTFSQEHCEGVIVPTIWLYYHCEPSGKNLFHPNFIPLQNNSGL